MAGFLSNLNVMHRLGLLGIIAFVLMAIPTSFYVILSWQDFAKAKKESVGLIPAAALLEVIRLTQQHRGLSAVWLSGNAGVAAKRANKQAEVEAAMTRLSTIVKEHVTGPKAIADWKKAEVDWREIHSALSLGEFSKKQSFVAHNHLIDDILNAGDRFNDEFALSHDSDAGFSHLVQTVLYLLPEISDSMGKARAVGAAVLSKGSLSLADRVTLSSLLFVARRSIVAIDRETELMLDARPELRALVEEPIKAAMAASREAMELTESQVLNQEVLSYSSADYFEQYTGAIDAQLAVSRSGLEGLGELLKNRISERRTKLINLAIQLIFTTGLGLWLGYLIAQSIRRQLGGEPKEVVSIARAVAKGELTTHIKTSHAHEKSLIVAMAEMQSSLTDLVVAVRDSSESIVADASEIAASNQDLSHRTEQHAASLEETAAAIVKITATAKQSTLAVGQAKEMAESANAAAIEGGAVVKQVHNTMHAIEESAKKIHNIIGVVDEIAFQTNILALNAAVEAARAGEQGRGFAVVATEVRTLAQRSAEAAQQVRLLIAESVESVSTGSALVAKAGVSTEAIVGQVKTVSELLVDIANASMEQAQGIGQIDSSMSAIDQATQQNTAMVEESAASAEALRQEAEKLSSLVSVFKVNDTVA